MGPAAKDDVRRLIDSDPDLTPLYLSAIQHYRDNEAAPWLVKPSIPIVYFGDLHGYLTSTRRIVTVALNPSLVEFTEKRFRITTAESDDLATLEESLSNYFRLNPYHDWFRSFETMLQPLGASYYGTADPGRAPLGWTPRNNTALHTDIASPLATNPTWSRLADDVKLHLQSFGFSFWVNLIQALQPHIILMSVGRSHLAPLQALPWREFNAFSSCYASQRMMIAPFLKSHIIWGPARRRPLASLPEQKRSEIARTILAQPELNRLAVL